MPSPSLTSTRRRAIAGAAVALAIGAALLATLGAAQVLLVSDAASDGGPAPTPREHEADAEALLAAYDENLLDPAPAIRSLLDEVAARPGVAEAALVSDAGVELVGRSSADDPVLIEEAPVTALSPAVRAALAPDAARAVDGDLVAQPLVVHDEPHALVVLREDVPSVVLLADVRRIVLVTVTGALVLLGAGLVAHGRSLSRRHARAVLRAGVDPLTGLGGHRLFREELTRQCGASIRRERSLTLALVDLDGFADLNAAQGLRYGDAVLAEVGAILASGRSEDLPFHVGADRFAVLFPHTTAAEAAVAVERVRAAIAGGIRGVTASAGLAELDADVPGAGALLARAELALHDAKASGRDTVVTYDGGVSHAAR
jgi:diguanylate cyclase (GGDEF)-like protein